MSKSEEHSLQNEIRNALAGHALMFRGNVGTGWASNNIESYSKPTHVVMKRGDKLLRGARPFDTGLPPGFSDLFGMKSVTITQDMVGKNVAVFFGMEVKDKAKTSSGQSNFLGAVIANGGIAGVVKSVDDAKDLLCITRQK